MTFIAAAGARRVSVKFSPQALQRSALAGIGVPDCSPMHRLHAALPLRRQPTDDEYGAITLP